MPTITLTNRELQYLKDIIFTNTVDGHSHYVKITKPLDIHSPECELIREVDLNLTNKINNAKPDGFQG